MPICSHRPPFLQLFLEGPAATSPRPSPPPPAHASYRPLAGDRGPASAGPDPRWRRTTRCAMPMSPPEALEAARTVAAPAPPHRGPPGDLPLQDAAPRVGHGRLLSSPASGLRPLGR